MGGAFFLFFGAPTLAFNCYHYSCQVSNGRDKSGAVFTFIVTREAFTAANFLNPQNSYFLGRRTFEFIIRLCGLNFRPVMLHF